MVKELPILKAKFIIKFQNMASYNAVQVQGILFSSGLINLKCWMYTWKKSIYSYQFLILGVDIALKFFLQILIMI